MTDEAVQFIKIVKVSTTFNSIQIKKVQRNISSFEPLLLNFMISQPTFNASKIFCILIAYIVYKSAFWSSVLLLLVFRSNHFAFKLSKINTSRFTYPLTSFISKLYHLTFNRNRSGIPHLKGFSIDLNDREIKGKLLKPYIPSLSLCNLFIKYDAFLFCNLSTITSLP